MTIFYDPNNQKYKESESIVLNLEVLSIKYQNLLIQYKQAVADYVMFLNNPDNKNVLSSIPGQAFWGTGQAGTQSAYNDVKDVASCSALCLKTANCTGATFNPTNFSSPMCWLRTGDGSPVPSHKSDNAIMLKSKILLINMQNINNQLLSVNKEILDIIASSNSIYSKQYNDRSQNASILLDNYKKINNERIKINKIVSKYEDLDRAQNQTTLMTNSNYYSFLLLFALVIVFLIVLIRYSYPRINTTSNGSLFQKGGELSVNFYYILFVIILLIITIYYIWFFSDYINIRKTIINIITSISDFIKYGTKI
jgi:hypothetical protein